MGSLQQEVGGIDLSEMIVKQMEKIEELTLYVIKQQKELDKLKKKLKVLNK